MLNKLNKAIFYILAGFVALELFFFLPLGPNRLLADDFNKTFLLWLVIPVCFILYLFAMFTQGEFKRRQTELDLPILVFLGAMLVSTIFSQDVFSSFFGARTAIGLPMMSVIMLVGLYFLLTQVFSAKEIKHFLSTILSLLTVLIFWGFIVITGAWLELFTDTSTFNNIFRSAIGTLEDFSIYVVLTNLILLVIFRSKELKKYFNFKAWQTVILRITFLISWVLIIIINFLPAWWVLFVGLLIYSLYYKKFKGVDKKEFARTIIILLIPIVFIIGDYIVLDQGVRDRRLASRLQLNREQSRGLIVETVRDKPLNGYGLETFSQVFSQKRSAEMNQTPYWYLRFNRGATYVCELMISAGILGFLSYLFLIIYIFIQFYKNARQKSDDELNFLLLIIVFALVLATFTFTPNLWLHLLFWLILALYFVNNRSLRAVILKQADNASKFQLVAIISFALLLGMTVLSAVSLKYWLAEAYFKNAKASEDQMIRAAQLNPNRMEFHVALAKHYKNKALAYAGQVNSQTILVELGKSVAESRRWAEQAVEVASNSVVAHETLGMILRDLKNYFENGELQALESFKRAIELEPSNPVLLSELGIVYLGLEQSELARDTFREALELKPNFYNAEYNLAKTYSLRQEYEMAIEIFARLARERKTTELYYELGRAQFNSGDLEGAIESFNQVIAQDPLHANALYSLGLALAEAGDKDEALYFLNKVLDLNPGNLEVEAKIKSVK